MLFGNFIDIMFLENEMRHHPLGICNLRVYVRKLKPVNDATESRNQSQPPLHFPLLWVTEPYTARHRVSRHGLTASQAPPTRLLVKYRWSRRIAQRATVPSALEGQGKRCKKHPHFFIRCAPWRLSPTTA